LKLTEEEIKIIKNKFEFYNFWYEVIVENAIIFWNESEEIISDYYNKSKAVEDKLFKDL